MAKGINIAESYNRILNNFSNRSKPVVFLSHKSEDKDYVEAVGNYIMNAGIDIYLDKNDFNLQRAVKDEDPVKVTECIQEGISNSDYILCFVSQNTVKSWWVPYEIGYGKKANKGIDTLVRKDVTYIPDYLQIENTIENISEINEYIKRIAKKHNIILNEKCSFEDISLSEQDIKVTNSSHELARYLKL